MCDSSERKYCEKCGTLLKKEYKEETNYEGRQRSYYILVCPTCVEREFERKRIEAQKKQQEENERIAKIEREKALKRQERLKKYIKYMPKKVTSIVLMTNEAVYLRDLLSRERNKSDDPMIEVLYQKLMKAKNDTDINLTEAYEYAKEKGWEE